MEFGKIEKGVTYDAGFTEILRQCEVGDSFLWHINNIHQSAHLAGMKIKTKLVKDKTGVYRIWRIA